MVVKSLKFALEADKVGYPWTVCDRSPTQYEDDPEAQRIYREYVNRARVKKGLDPI